DSLTYTLVTDPANGSVVFNANGTFAYTPDTDFSGIDSFIYRVSDGNGGTDTATVALNLTGQNDAPVAQNDEFSGLEDNGAITGTVASNDSDIDGDTLTYTLIGDVLSGSLTFNADGSFSYTPDADFNGIDSFTYRVSDGN